MKARRPRRNTEKQQKCNELDVLLNSNYSLGMWWDTLTFPVRRRLLKWKFSSASLCLTVTGGFFFFLIQYFINCFLILLIFCTSKISYIFCLICLLLWFSLESSKLWLERQYLLISLKRIFYANTGFLIFQDLMMSVDSIALYEVRAIFSRFWPVCYFRLCLQVPFPLQLNRSSFSCTHKIVTF